VNKKKICILGASLGGLVAASELTEHGFSVDIFEKSQSIGGLFNKIKTPFGLMELGMHVLYVSRRQYTLLTNIFGKEAFEILEGVDVDIGGSANFGKTNFNSLYPNLIGHEDQSRILEEILRLDNSDYLTNNALQEAERRFGYIAAKKIISPILEKLWDMPADHLSPGSLHCFYDLRRLVICDKIQTDYFKSISRLDKIIANPDQLKPHGIVFDNRIGLSLKDHSADYLKEKVLKWSKSKNNNLFFESDIRIKDYNILIDDKEIARQYDAIIASFPIHNLSLEHSTKLDISELSVLYLKLDKNLKEIFPSYYILVHQPSMKCSRIVNYDGYNKGNKKMNDSIVAVETIHPSKKYPSELEIENEVLSLFPKVSVKDIYKLEKTLKICKPSINNGILLDDLENKIIKSIQVPIYFTGMRTDKGIFFSHNVIGLAHEASLEISKKYT
jgi:hypothetical protein